MIHHLLRYSSFSLALMINHYTVALMINHYTLTGAAMNH